MKTPTIGSLLRIKEYCRKNATIKDHGEYAVLAPAQAGNYIKYDAVFPSGHRIIFMPRNWEVVSYAR